MTLLFYLLVSAPAEAKLCNPLEEKCWLKSNSSSSPAYPSKNSQIRLNPSAVPVEKGFGIETILFQGGADVALVKGLGRVGAAVSPSNGEETFFGPPGPELTDDWTRSGSTIDIRKLFRPVAAYR